MRIGIFGRGRLGSAIGRRAGDTVAWQIGRTGSPGGAVDVAVDASAAAAVPEHLEWALSSNCPLVIGTTGWNIPDLRMRVGSSIGVLVAPNFSLTVALLARVTRVFGRYAAREPRFDPYLVEHHQARKHDAPSGTARLLASALLDSCPRKKRFRIAGDEGPIGQEELCIGVVRAGTTYSSHVVGLDAPEEVLEVRHEARNADAFAAGCLEACRWILGRKGVFGMDDVARDALNPLFVESEA